jgi:hypothetical protein
VAGMNRRPISPVVGAGAGAGAGARARARVREMVILSDVVAAYLPMACIIIRGLLLDALLGGRDRIRKRSRDLD